MKDPYQVLGVQPTATDDEIKSAYRALARKYHPDKYRDSDVAELAEEKMKEVNAAYDEIQKMRSGQFKGNRQNQSGQNQGSGNGSYGPYNANGHTGYTYIRQLINARRLGDATRILDDMPEADRDAEWYFLKGVIAAYAGHHVDAQSFIDTACGMDPDNLEYRNAADRLRNGNPNFGNGQMAGGDPCCSFCAGMACMNCCCNCCRG